MPAGSKMDPPLAKAEPISSGGSASGVIAAREEWEYERGTTLQTPRNRLDTAGMGRTTITSGSNLPEDALSNKERSIMPGHRDLGNKGVPEQWKKGNVTPFFKMGKEQDHGNYKLVSFILISGKVLEKTLLEAFSKHIKWNKMNRNSQNGFSKERLCLTNRKTFYDEVTGEMDEV
ncbi:mitochondrial enolase superfamily member 1 [Grus japonensis]|uniref:Mitochondrial enolase superfamily member 1 n=1 Tax=Grus japonensis TaxID=30415 RepID=A0ABC9W516_GRUJA